MDATKTFRDGADVRNPKRALRRAVSASALAVLTAFTSEARAVDGCLVLLCFAAPSWRSIPQCVPPINQVLRDLARYCHARDSSFRFSVVTKQGDALATAFAEGQRDVFNRIVSMARLSDEQIDRIAQHRSNHDE